MKNILATLAFFAKYRGLHSFDKRDRSTNYAIKSLEKRGYLCVNWHTKQAEYTGKTLIRSIEND